VADREGLIPRLRRSYAAGRDNFEQTGLAGVPLELEREAKARLSIVLADLSEMQPGLERGYEIWRQFTTAAAGEFALLSVTCADGFYLERLRTQAAASAGLITVTTAQPATSSLAGTLNASRFLAIPRLAVTQGRTAVALGSQYFVAGGVEWIQRLWIPPGFFLNLGLDTANVQSDWQLIVSGVAAR
jgi:hypothetical protein